MKRGVFYTEKNHMIFRTPKYTGVTLSLLSIFVLVCMLAVWEKMSHHDSPPSITGLVWSECRTPVEQARIEFEKTTNTRIKLNYLSTSELIEQLLHRQKEVMHSPSLAIFPLFTDEAGKLSEKDWKERIPIAHRAPSEKNRAKKEISLIGSVPTDSNASQPALEFIRFLTAPSRGQFFFAQDEWIGVRGDKWSLSPKLEILAPKAMQPVVTQAITQFESREGIKVDGQFLDPNQLTRVLLLTSKSKGKEYLPDLAWITPGLLSSQIQELVLTDVTTPYSFENKEYQGYVSKWSQLPQSSRRLNDYIRKILIHEGS